LYEIEEAEFKYSGSPHQIFANIDVSDNESIEAFYKDFGPLGFYNRDVIALVQPNSKSSKGIPIVAIVRDSINRSNNFRLLSLEELKEKYHIANKKVKNITTDDVLFQMPSDECIDTSESIKDFFKDDEGDDEGDDEILNPDDILHEIPVIDSFNAWESLEDFKEAHGIFTWVMNLVINLEHKNVQKLKELIFSDNIHIAYDPKIPMEEHILSEASRHINFNISTQLNDTVSPTSSMDELGNNLSRDITWKCKSLITAMWLMLLLDITKSKYNSKCANCGKWFYAGRPHGLYCGNTCKYRANKRNQKYKAEHLKKDNVMKLLRQGTSIEKVIKLKGIRKKTIEKWMKENMEV